MAFQGEDGDSLGAIPEFDAVAVSGGGEDGALGLEGQTR